MFFVAGIVLLVASVAMAAWAVYSYVKLDIRAVRDDLSGRSRNQKAAKKRRCAQGAGTRNVPDPDKAAVPKKSARAFQEPAQASLKEPSETEKKQSEDPRQSVAPKPAKPRKNVSLRIVRKEIQAKAAIDLDYEEE